MHHWFCSIWNEYSLLGHSVVTQATMFLKWPILLNFIFYLSDNQTHWICETEMLMTIMQPRHYRALILWKLCNFHFVCVFYKNVFYNKHLLLHYFYKKIAMTKEWGCFGHTILITICNFDISVSQIRRVWSQQTFHHTKTLLECNQDQIWSWLHPNNVIVIWKVCCDCLKGRKSISEKQNYGWISNHAGFSHPLVLNVAW